MGKVAVISLIVVGSAATLYLLGKQIGTGISTAITNFENDVKNAAGGLLGDPVAPNAYDGLGVGDQQYLNNGLDSQFE